MDHGVAGCAGRGIAASDPRAGRVLQLPDRVSFGAAANPADVAASGWELAAPTANRFVHLDWRMPLDVYAESLVTGDWPVLPVPVVPPDIEALVAAQRGLVAGFLRSRGGQLSSIPSDAAGRGRAFPTPRTWDYAARLLAIANDLGRRCVDCWCTGQSERRWVMSS